jgi:hypothetical protein
MTITQEELKEWLVFNNDIGRFFWKKKYRGIHTSKTLEAGSFDAHGYGQIRIRGEIYKEHRLVWLYVYGKWPDGQIDHINHNRRDNRVENLREVNNSENHKNRPLQRNNKTGVPGVCFYPKKGYYAYINVNGKRLNLGMFGELEEAISARRLAESNLGFHKNHGVGHGREKPKSSKRNKSVLDRLPLNGWRTIPE